MSVTYDDLAQLTLRELKERAEKLNMQGYKSCRKAALIDRLVEAAKETKATSSPVDDAAGDDAASADDVTDTPQANETVDVFGYISTKEPFNPFATSFGVINLFIALEFVNLVIRAGSIDGTSNVGFYPPFTGKFYTQEYYQHVLSWVANLVIAPLVIGVIFNADHRSSYSAFVFSVSRYLIYHFFGTSVFLQQAFDYVPVDLFVATSVCGILFSFWDHIATPGRV